MIIKYVIAPIFAIVLLFFLQRVIIFLEINKKNRKMINSVSKNFFNKITGFYLIKHSLIKKNILKLFIVINVIFFYLIILTFLCYIIYVITKYLIILEINFIIIRIILAISLVLIFINAVKSNKKN